MENGYRYTIICFTCFTKTKKKKKIPKEIKYLHRIRTKISCTRLQFVKLYHNKA